VLCCAVQEEELSRQQRKEAAEAHRAAERHAAQQKRDEESTEKLQLLVALRTARKSKADELGQVGACLLPAEELGVTGPGASGYRQLDRFDGVLADTWMGWSLFHSESAGNTYNDDEMRRRRSLGMGVCVQTVSRGNAHSGGKTLSTAIAGLPGTARKVIG
jgi:hypothetical protein